jgi:hypothetical protein
MEMKSFEDIRNKNILLISSWVLITSFCPSPSLETANRTSCVALRFLIKKPYSC